MTLLSRRCRISGFRAAMALSTVHPSAFIAGLNFFPSSGLATATNS